MILVARDPADRGPRAAWKARCCDYLYPLHAPPAAEDVVQGTFGGLITDTDWASLDRSLGRFRSFLMAACSHHLANLRDHDRAQKRGGGGRPISIDRNGAEGRHVVELIHGLTAERLFDRRWALILPEQAMGRLAVEMAWWARRNCSTDSVRRSPGGVAPLARRCPGPLRRSREDGCTLAATPLPEALRDEVGRTLADPSEVEEAIRDLFNALGR